MRKPSNPNDYELRDEYDFSKMTNVAKGRYAPHRRTGKNVVLLAPDLARAFPSDESVNEALRLVLQIAKIPTGRKAKAPQPRKTNAKTAASRRVVKQETT